MISDVTASPLFDMMALGLLDHVVPHLDVSVDVLNCLSRFAPVGMVYYPLLVNDPVGTVVAFESGCSRIEQIGHVVGATELRLLSGLMRPAVTVPRQTRLHVCAAALAVSEFFESDAESEVIEQKLSSSRLVSTLSLQQARWMVAPDACLQRRLSGELYRVFGDDVQSWELFAVLVADGKHSDDQSTTIASLAQIPVSLS